MTYCLSIKVESGLVFCSDSRTNAGPDRVSTFSKMHRFHNGGERQLVLLSAGNLATTQAVVDEINRDLKEGAKNNIHINCLSPTAATRMTEDILSPEMIAKLDPVYATPAAVYMVSKEAPNHCVMFAGAGTYTTMQISEGAGINLPEDQRNAEGIAANFAAISDMSNPDVFHSGTEHVVKVVQKAE